MTHTTDEPTRARAGRPRGKHARKRIPLPNGDELWPRGDLADELDIDVRTVQRMRLPTIRVGGAAYHPHDESLGILASKIRRPRPEPTNAKRRGRR
jgi:hypothetical protein